MSFFELFKFIVTQTPGILFGIIIFCIVSIYKHYDLKTNPIVLILILSLSLLIGLGIYEILKLIMRKLHDRFKFKKHTKYINNLTSKEKDILRYYIENNSLEQILFPSGEITSLIRNNILYYNRNEIGNKKYYNIEKWAYDYLKKHQDLIN